MEIKCPSCGANVPEGSTFCQNCGNPISQTAAPSQPEQSASQAYAAGQQPPYASPAQPYAAPQQPPYTSPVPPYAAGQQPPYTAPDQQPPYVPYGQPGAPVPPGVPVPPGYQQKSRVAAGILGILLGGLGIHNFYLGNTQRALIQLLVSLLTCGIGALPMEIWGLVEGIQILTGSISVDAHGVPLKD